MRSPRPFPISPAPPSRRLPVLLRRAWYGLNQAFRRRILHTGSTPDQYIVLRNLHEADPHGITQSRLTRLMSSDPNTIAALLNRMTGLNLVERSPHEKDRRAKRVRLTPAGRRRYAELRKFALALQAEILARLEPAQRDAFLEQLETVADACQHSAEVG